MTASTAAAAGAEVVVEMVVKVNDSIDSSSGALWT